METLFGESNSLFGEVSPNICKNSFLDSPIFSSARLSSLKVYIKFVERMMQKHIQERSQTSKIELFVEIINFSC